LGAGLVLPCIMLNMKIVRENYALLALAMLLNCFGAVMNRFVMIIQALAIPVLPFEKYLFYSATWQEWGITFGVIAYGFIVFSLAYRYLPVFPQERELNKA
jgi:Ni/Fe-hydrogenase subunit HybB-like protein